LEKSGKGKPELWAGVECTVNRVRDNYYDQLQFSRHWSRESDLELFAGLGAKAIRYPVLWEHVESTQGVYDWQWQDRRLGKLRQLGMEPIAGLVHHGSGPLFTSLIDPEFPEKLAHYAGKVAERYPWLRLYNPVNEPLTTARFSGMYGLWYPHGTCASTFIQCLLNECKGVVLAMRAIRAVNPDAQLIQSEDLGKTHSTRKLAYQARFENERRWLSFDILAGKVDEEHWMWDYLVTNGADPADLLWFVDNPCAPDMLGLNYYITSERYLDENLTDYPVRTHGGNGRHRYADVEAVRVPRGMEGPEKVFGEAWERYGIPIAITEAHLSCTREEQMRWLKGIWDAASNLSNSGADVRAVTVWSLLGAYDWNSLLTRVDGYYEPGAFDLRSSEPRPTALAKLAKTLGSGEDLRQPLLEIPAWWQRPQRVLYGAKDRLDNMSQYGSHKKVLITGATGTLGRAYARICEIRGIPYVLLGRKDMDIADAGQVRQVLEQVQPWAVVNTAGYVRVDDAERERNACLRENAAGPATLAAECKRLGIKLVTYSSDLVFDGNTSTAYIESHPVAPLNVYGESKAQAERLVLEEDECALVVRTSAFFGPWDEYNFVTMGLTTLAKKQPFAACSDSTVSPTYVPDLVNGSLDLLLDGECGVWHLANCGETTWADFARATAEAVGLDSKMVEALPSDEMGWVAQRPKYSALHSERGLMLPSLEDALSRYLKQSEFLAPVLQRRRRGYAS
jgi:dTDP-4-dehydrorhamnose reductase